MNLFRSVFVLAPQCFGALIVLGSTISCSPSVGEVANMATPKTPAPKATSTKAKPVKKDGAKAIFLHHSTGECIWGGGVEQAFASLNSEGGTHFTLTQRAFPNSPWPWDNYPSDYYRLWVGGEGKDDNENIQTLEGLTRDYDLIIFKHCFPVNNIGADEGAPNAASPNKTLANYKAAYNALKQKMHSFPEKRFIVWTGAVLTSASDEEFQRLRQFHDWVVNDWDEKGDNIFVFDFYALETGGGMKLKPENASGGDSHPNAEFSKATAPKFAKRVYNVLMNRGDETPLTGE